MTVLKAFALNVLMLAMTIGVLYWASEQGNDTESAQGIAVLAPADTPNGETDSKQASEQESAASAPARVISGVESTKAVAARAALAPRRPVTFPLDLNTARLEDFMELPGIGEKLAQRLVEYRKRHGGFRNIEELRKVRGIGEKRMERLRPLVMTAEIP